MNPLRLIVFFVTFFVTFSSFESTAQLTFDIGDLRYARIGGVNNVEVYRVPGTPCPTNRLVIPSNVMHNGINYTVLHIASAAFSGCNGITSVQLPSNLTHINKSAFSSCTSLKSIDFPSTLSQISSFAFYDCNALESVTIPWNTLSIGQQAFALCTSLSTVNLPSIMKELGSLIFNGCTSLSSIDLSSVRRISFQCFGGCTSLNSLTFSDDLEFIGEKAFQGCSGLSEITFPSSLKSISKDAFRLCTGLQTIKNLSSRPQAANKAFSLINRSQVNLIVPFGSQPEYSTNDDWKFFGSLSTINKISSVEIDNCFNGISDNIDNSNNNEEVYFHDEKGELICMINANGNNLGEVNISVYKSSTDRIIDGIPFMNRNVTISPQTQPITPVTVRIFYSKEELTALKNQDPSIALNNLQFTKTSNSCSGNIGETEIVEIQQSTSGNIFSTEHFVEAQASSFSTFYSTKALALPVEYSLFDAKPSGDQVNLNWFTLNEQNNDGFNVEHSLDGSKWSTLDFIKGAGNSYDEINYSYIHYFPRIGSNYYRLRQVDFDGLENFSTIKQINFSTKESIIYPNPTSNFLHLADNQDFKIFDVVGKIYLVGRSSVIDVSSLQNGIYFLQTGEHFTKFLKH